MTRNNRKWLRVIWKRQKEQFLRSDLYQGTGRISWSLALLACLALILNRWGPPRLKSKGRSTPVVAFSDWRGPLRDELLLLPRLRVAVIVGNTL